MPNGEQFPHIRLLLVRYAPPRKPKPQKIPKPLNTEENLKKRAIHHGKINSSIRKLLEEDHSLKADRLENGLPILEDQIALFLQIDERGLKIDDLRKYDCCRQSIMAETGRYLFDIQIDLSEKRGYVEWDTTSARRRAIGLNRRLLDAPDPALDSPSFTREGDCPARILYGERAFVFVAH